MCDTSILGTLADAMQGTIQALVITCIHLYGTTGIFVGIAVVVGVCFLYSMVFAIIFYLVRELIYSLIRMYKRELLRSILKMYLGVYRM